MNISVTIDQASLDSFVRSTEQRLGQVKQDVARAMSDVFYATVMANIGDYGLDRPIAWQALGPQHAKRTGRSHATLYLEDSLRKGKGPHLRDCVKWEPEAATVSISDNDCPYATAHQFGLGKQPARPYFPIISGEHDPIELTAKTQEAVMQAAREEFSKAFA